MVKFVENHVYHFWTLLQLSSLILGISWLKNIIGKLFKKRFSCINRIATVILENLKYTREISFMRDLCIVIQWISVTKKYQTNFRFCFLLEDYPGFSEILSELKFSFDGMEQEEWM